MFIQIIQGKCTRQDELRAMADSWRENLSDTAVGWLGGTYGFTDDNEFIGIVRFESREAAMANGGSFDPPSCTWRARPRDRPASWARWTALCRIACESGSPWNR